MEAGQFAAGKGTKQLDELGLKVLKWAGNAAFSAKGLKFLGKGTQGAAKATAIQVKKTAWQRGAGFIGRGLTATARCAPVIGAAVVGGVAAADQAMDAAKDVKQGNYRNATVGAAQAATRFTGAAGGALAGAQIGAVMGSVVPGVGTVIGGVAGGIVGGLAGDWGAQKIAGLMEKLKNHRAVEAARQGEQALGLGHANGAGSFALNNASADHEITLLTQAASQSISRAPNIYR
jgi:phage tail tape-measure protein